MLGYLWMMDMCQTVIMSPWTHEVHLGVLVVERSGLRSVWNWCQTGLWLFCMSWIKQLCFLLCVKKYILLFRIRDTFIFLSSLDLIFEIFFLKFKQMFWNRNLLLNKDVDFSECVLLWKNCFVSNQMILEVRQQQLQHYSNPEMRKLKEEHNVIIYLMQL